MRLVRFSATLIPLLIGLAPGVIESQAVKKASAAHAASAGIEKYLIIDPASGPTGPFGGIGPASEGLVQP